MEDETQDHEGRPSKWILRKIGCAEPVRLYSMVKARGMSFLTITDHDTIAGMLQAAFLNQAGPL